MEHRGAYVVLTEDGERVAPLAGRLRHAAASPDDLPTVGDWVALEGALATALLPRRTVFRRGAVGGLGEPQLVCANVDVLFVVDALPLPNPRRLERYLALARASGAEPVVVLTKADLSPDGASTVAEVGSVSGGAAVHLVSAATGDGVDALRAHLAGDRTVALVGPSGAGKSTLTNRLVGAEAQATQHVAADGRGRHTTTRRELLLVPGGGVLVDTPGMRELRLFGDDLALDDTFAEVAAAAERCRFRDCAHAGEPGCAVRAALDEGAIDPERWRSYEKLEREARSAAIRADARAASDLRRRHKALARAARAKGRERG